MENKVKYCAVCGKKIKNKRNKKFCGYECAGIYKQHYVVCPVCGGKFKKSPSDVTTITCGKERCREEQKRKSSGTSSENIKKYALTKISSSPKTGHFETHHAAVEWQIVSPSGELYEFKNLILWVEKNADLLPVSPRTGERVQPKTFVREITRLKSGNEKYTYSRDNYYGWRVIKDSGKERDDQRA